MRARAVVFIAALAMAPVGGLAAVPTVSDGAQAEAILTTLEAQRCSLCADLVKRARFALERARRMRRAGDERHARLTDGLALILARTAEELLRADHAEAEAATARALAADAGAHVERERASLEQQLAENGRMQAELAKLEADGGPSVAREGGAR